MMNLRVLQLVSGLSIGDAAGGADLFGVELARHFDRQRVTPVVCAFWQRHTAAEAYFVNLLRAARIDVFFAAERGSGFTLSKYWQVIRRLQCELRIRNLDVLHSHFQLGSVTGLLLKRSLGNLPLVRTAHGTVNFEWSNQLPGLVSRQVFTKWIFPLNYTEVGVSRAVKHSLDARLCARLTGKQASFIPNGIPIEKFVQVSSKAKTRTTLNLPEDCLIVGSVGRLSEQKGYTYLLRAVPDVITHIPKVRFVIIGGGELHSDLVEQAKQLGIEDYMLFVGQKENVEVWLSAMDLFVLPSLWEGLPTVIIEAMASGVPIIATDIKGTQELIDSGRTGWLVPPKEPEQLSRLIIQVLASVAERKYVSDNARLAVIDRYDMSVIAGEYVKLYNKKLDLR
jgi:glycosyltransferase involved in cell wall biosynthesis